MFARPPVGQLNPLWHPVAFHTREVEYIRTRTGYMLLIGGVYIFVVLKLIWYQLNHLNTQITHSGEK